LFPLRSNHTMHESLAPQDTLDHIISTSLKPARYKGSELHSSHKEWDAMKVRAALIFPDTYEVGQSGLGLKILYALLARDPETLVERAFAPWVDFEEKLRASSIPLFSLESGRALSDFDLLGFTLPYEMTFTNVLNILELAHIPPLSQDRGDEYPLVAGGGSCVFNPEPVSDFFDFLVLGDGEEVILEILEILKEWKSHSRKKDEVLNALSHVQGIYVPRFYEPSGGAGMSGALIPVSGEYPAFIGRRVVRDLDRAFFPTSPIVPFVETVHDRIMLEIFRGCTRGCRFCQAGMIYRPVRERTLPTLLQIARESLRNTGYEEISLVSLSCSDYSAIKQLSSSLIEEYGDSYLEISLPSLRIDSFSLELAKLVQKFRRTTLTFAPEVGTQKMRDIINKGGSEEDVLETVNLAKKEGWSSVKLYFLIGLPEEEEEDLLGITGLVWKILQATGLRMNISVSSFIPKPWTAFQWEEFTSPEVLQGKISVIKRLLRHGKLNISCHNPQLSFIEAIFARGDRRLGRVLLEARKLGCRFDGWNDHFNFPHWVKAFEHASVDPADYTRKREHNEALPWDHLGSPRQREFLARERQKAQERLPTQDCRHGACNQCGVCTTPVKISTPQDADAAGSPEAPAQDSRKPPSLGRVRVKFTKESPIRLISHLDLMRALQRIVRRAFLPVSYSEGFHPRLRMAFGPALSLGYTSAAEWMDIELRTRPDPESIKKKLEEASFPGISIKEVREIPLSAKALSEIIYCASYRLRLQIGDGISGEGLSRALAGVMKRTSIIMQRKEKEFDIRPLIHRIELACWDPGDRSADLDAWLRISPEGSAKPQDLIYAISGNGLDVILKDVQRTGLYTRKGSEWVEPW
jgi:radical SAM family uncharacterized protein/radical SAM-linked protein